MALTWYISVWHGLMLIWCGRAWGGWQPVEEGPLTQGKPKKSLKLGFCPNWLDHVPPTPPFRTLGQIPDGDVMSFLYFRSLLNGLVNFNKILGFCQTPPLPPSVLLRQNLNLIRFFCETFPDLRMHPPHAKKAHDDDDWTLLSPSLL